jgi:uncharacterized protein DUF6101
MSAGGAIPAGSGRNARLDPFSLPVRYKANDAFADQRERVVEVNHERVVMKRAVRGIAMKTSTLLSDFLGVAIRIVPPKDDFDGAVAVMLEHRDPGLSVPLFVAADGAEISVEWQTWSRVLGLPGLVVNADGTLRDPLGPLGRVQGNVKAPRKRGRVIARSRRSARRLRRKTGVRKLEAMTVHRDEREIIARN